MEFFEKEYKDRFGEAKSTDGIDPGAIWENISNALPEEEVIVEPKKSFIQRNRYLLSLLLLVFGGLGSALFIVGDTTEIAELNNKDTNKKQVVETLAEGKKLSEHTMTNEEKITALKLEEGKGNSANDKLQYASQKQSPSSTDAGGSSLFPQGRDRLLGAGGSDDKKDRVTTINDSNVQMNESPIENDEIKTKQQNASTSEVKGITANEKLTTLESNTSEKNISSEKEDELSQTKLTNSKTDSNNNRRLNNISTTVSENLKTRTETKEEMKRSESKEEKEERIILPEAKDVVLVQKVKVAEALFLPSLDRNGLFPTLENPFKVDWGPTIPNLRKGRNRKFKVGVFAGLLSWSDFYENTDLPNAIKNELEKTTSSDLGQSLTVSLQWNFAQHFHLSTGLEYINARTEFNYVSAPWDTIAVLEDYASLGPIDAIAVRTVKHNNQQQFVSIPILLGTSKNIGAFEIGAELGIGLNYVVNQTGKTLDEEGVVRSYDSKKTNSVPHQRFSLSYQLRPYLGYAITERFSLQLQPTIRYQQYEKSTLYGGKLSALSWGIQVGGAIGF